MALPQVTDARVEKVLNSEGLNFDRDDDGDFIVGFDYFVIYIHIDDNFLRLSALWRVELPDDETIDRAATAANALNQRLAMPKTVIGGPGPYVIFESSLASEAGLTDEQLEGFIVHTFYATFAAEDLLVADLPDLAPERVEEEK